MADSTTNNLTDDERQRLLAASSQPLIPSLHSIPPLPQAKEISLLGGAATPPGVAQQRYAGMKPQVSAMPGTPEYGQQRQQQLDFQKLTPWGNEAVSEHPGTWGKIGHIASRIGNIAGDILAPGITANIPGSDLNKQREAATNAKWINLGSENELRGAQAEKAKADVPLEQEQVKNLQSEEQARLHPKPPAEKEEEWNIVPGIQGPNGEPIQQEKHSGQMRAATLGKVAEKPEKLSTSEDLQHRIAVAQESGDMATVKRLQNEARAIAPLAEDRIRDAEARAADARARGNDKTDLATREKVLTYYKAAQDADVRLRLMEHNEQDALKGDQQAMVNLLANHVAMTMGIPRGKVPRISHEMFQEAQQSAPWLQRVESHFDKEGYLTGVVLSPDQVHKMVNLGRETREAEWQAAHSSADYIGVDKADRPKSLYPEKGASAAAPAAGGITIDRDANGRIIGVH